MRRPVPVADGSILVTGARDRRLIRIGPDGTQESFTLPDSFPRATMAFDRVGADRFLAFGTDDGGRSALHLIDWASRSMTRLASVPYEDGLAWLGADRDKAFLAIQTGPGRHELLGYSTGSGRWDSASLLYSGTMQYPAFSFSADRSRVIMFGPEEHPDIWLIRGALAARPR
jgi:hypothetical protein